MFNKRTTFSEVVQEVKQVLVHKCKENYLSAVVDILNSAKKKTQQLFVHIFELFYELY